MRKFACRYRGSYVSYVITFFFYFFAMAVFSSVLSVYLTGIGKSATEMSFIVSASGLFSFLIVPVVGYLNDRTRKPKIISAGILLGAGLLGLLFSVCREVWVLFLLDGFIMSFINCVMPVCERMAGASKYRYGAIRVWGTLGYAAGAQCAGLALQWISPSFIFVMLLISALLTAVGFWGTEEVQPPARPAESTESAEKPSLASLLKNPSFLLFLVIAFLFSGCSGVNMTYSPVLLTRLGVPASAVGTVLFFSTLVEIPLILFSNRFMDRFSGKVLLLGSFSIITVQFLFYGFTRSAAVVVTVMVLLKAIASTLFMMISLKVVRNLIPPELTTTGLSVVNSINSLGTILLQNLGGAVVDHSSIHTLYLGMTALTGLGLLLALFLKVSNREKVFA